MKANCVILSYSDLSRDPRIQRQVVALQEHYRIFSISKGSILSLSTDWTDIQIFPSFSILRKIKRLLFFVFRFYKKYYFDDYKRSLIEKFKHIEFDLVIANDIMTLPLALSLSRPNSRVYFDAHEFHPGEFSDNFFWRIFHRPYIKYLCLTYIPKANYFSSVSEGVCVLYEKFIGIRPILISNSCALYELEPNKIDSKNIKVIHHGACLRSREIERMIDLARLADARYSFYFMLTKNDVEYYQELLLRAANYHNIKFLEPVPYSEIPVFCNQFDIGIYLLPQVNDNCVYALPNKIFEYTQSRLCLLVSPNIEMANYVRKNSIGLVSKDFSVKSFVSILNSLTPVEIMHYKMNSHRIAYKENSKRNIEMLSNLLKPN